MKENAVAKALHDGLDHLRAHGLTKNELWNSAGQVCARGALSLGCHYGGPAFDVWEAADEILSAVAAEQYSDRSGYGLFPITSFNNHPDTTQEDVERVFEKAIVRAYEMEVAP